MDIAGFLDARHKKQDIYDEMIYSDSTEAEGGFNLGLFVEKWNALHVIGEEVGSEQLTRS